MGLQRHNEGVELLCQAMYDVDVWGEALEHFVVGGGAEHEGFHEDELGVAVGGSLLEDVTVCHFILLRIDGVGDLLGSRVEAAPEVVDADHDAEDVGVVVEAIPLPALFEVTNGIA